MTSLILRVGRALVNPGLSLAQINALNPVPLSAWSQSQVVNKLLLLSQKETLETTDDSVRQEPAALFVFVPEVNEKKTVFDHTPSVKPLEAASFSGNVSDLLASISSSASWFVRAFSPSVDPHKYAVSLVSQFGELQPWISPTKSAYQKLSQLYEVPTASPVAVLDCVAAFAGLSSNEKLYAHYIAQASFEGSKICLVQTSMESSLIFLVLQAVFSNETGESVVADLRARSLPIVGESDFNAFLAYAATFYTNAGNYKSFGDTKFIPGLARHAFESILRASPNFPLIESVWSKASDAVYSLTPKFRSLGLGDEGMTTYFSSNCDKHDAEVVQRFLDSHKISAYNTRLFKTFSAKGVEYEIRVASSKQQPTQVFEDGSTDEWAKITITFGDYAPIMARVVDNLKCASNFAANEVQRAMLNGYIGSFETGSIDDHKEGSRNWIHDKGPIVESYIGFIESFRDPYGVRGEWEGFSAVVNKEISLKFGVLVDGAVELLTFLPWGKDFEKDTFLRPDFTSLDVLGYGSSGIPSGINIPNYDDIRQNEGFKNVSLGNVLKANLTFSSAERVNFISDADQDIYKRTAGEAFDVQVGLHELLGHGSGKLLKKTDDGFNFDTTRVINPLTGRSIECWYGPGETWDSKFPSIGPSYEECRAESVGIFLSVQPKVLKIFGHEGERADEITYINWLNMVRAGVLALEFYTPGKGMAGWGQAHMMARFAILKVLLRAGENFVQIVQGEETQAGGKGTYVSLDRAKIHSVGVKAIHDFLLKLQVFKSTGDFQSGKAMYEDLTFVDDDMVKLREQVISNRKPRRMFVQHVTKVDSDGNVQLQTFEATHQGVIESFVARFPQTDEALLQQWQGDLKHFQ